MDARRRILRGCAGLVVTLVCWPAGTALADDEGELPGDLDTTCVEVMEGSGAHEVAMETDPADGSTVEGGETITARITWKVDDFADDVPLYATLDCVTIDGRLEEALSADERQAANDGEFTHGYTVPEGLAAGTEICARGAVAGNGRGYFERNKSNDVCFTVAEGQRAAPAISAPVAPAPPPAPSAAPEAPAVVPPAQVLGATEERPAVEAAPPAVSPQPVEQLPRTGRPDRSLAAFAGLLLFLGGAALRLSARRTPALS